jgi:hypothetical protein
MMREVMFVEVTRGSYGRSRENLVLGAIDTERIVAVQAGAHSTTGNTVTLLTDDGREFTVKGSVKDWIFVTMEGVSDTD